MNSIRGPEDSCKCSHAFRGSRSTPRGTRGPPRARSRPGPRPPGRRGTGLGERRRTLDLPGVPDQAAAGGRGRPGRRRRTPALVDAGRGDGRQPDRQRRGLAAGSGLPQPARGAGVPDASALRQRRHQRPLRRPGPRTRDGRPPRARLPPDVLPAQALGCRAVIDDPHATGRNSFPAREAVALLERLARGRLPRSGGFGRSWPPRTGTSS